MANNLTSLDSVGGFSVEKTIIVDKDKNVNNVNSLEIKNSFYQDSSVTKYILRGVNTSVLSLDDISTQIFIPSNTINFVTSNIIGVKNNASAVYSLKLENCIFANSIGVLQNLSSLETIIKDSIPLGETWTVTPFTSGFQNRFSYSVVRAGSVDFVKWVAYTEVVSIDWPQS
jgi:hypothetical protein